MTMQVNMKKHSSGYLWPLIGVLAVVLLVWWALGNTQPAGGPSGTSSATGSSAALGGSKSGSAKTSGTDVVSVAEGLQNASIFASWMRSTGVASELSGTTYTIFAPTDAAISALPSGTFRNLSAAEKKRFVEYHIIAGQVIDANATLSGNKQALSGDYLNFTKRDGLPPLVGSAPVLEKHAASNGVVYVIGGVLIPPKTR